MVYIKPPHVCLQVCRYRGMFWLTLIQATLTFIRGNVLRGVWGACPPVKEWDSDGWSCVSEISFALGEAQFTISSTDYFLATGETLVLSIVSHSIFTSCHCHITPNDIACWIIILAPAILKKNPIEKLVVSTSQVFHNVHPSGDLSLVINKLSCRHF